MNDEKIIENAENIAPEPTEPETVDTEPKPRKQRAAAKKDAPTATLARLTVAPADIRNGEPKQEVRLPDGTTVRHF